MADITLSTAVRNNLLSLQNTAKLMGETQERLATGLKVNSALDDPTAFFTAQSLSSRAGDLNRLLDSVGNAVQTVTAADKGISAITKLVENAQATARQALQSPPVSITAEVDGTGTIGADSAASVAGGTTVGADAAAEVTGSATIGADVAAVATGGIGAGTQELDADGLNIADGATLSITIGGTAYTVEFDSDSTDAGTADLVFDFSSNETVDDLIGALDTLIAASGSVTEGTGDELVITADDATADIEISGSAGLLAQLGLDSVGSGPDADNRTVEPTNADLTALAGQSLDITVGSGATLSITFGTDDGAGEVSTLDELETALGALAGGTATVAGGDLVITATDSADSITTSASDAAVNTAFGITDGTTDPSNADLTALAGQTLDITIGTNDTLSITFGTGTGEVDTLDELETALGGLQGGTATVAGGDLVITAANATDSITTEASDAAVNTAFGISDSTTSASNADLTALAGQTLALTIGDNDTLTITFGTDDDAGEVNNLAELATALEGLEGGTATVTGGQLSIAADSDNDSITTLASDAAVNTAFGITDETTAPTAGVNAARTSLEAQFNSLRSQIDQLAADSGYNGVNLLNGDDLSVIFNEDGSSTLGIDGVEFDSEGLGITSVATGDFQTNSGIQTSLDQLSSAINTLRSQASTFGSNLSVVEVRQDFTKNMINTLETGAANLTLADTNEEGANLLALQTRQQLSTTALSMASQADQNVLRLF